MSGNKIIKIRDRRPKAALEALNRTTGLTWSELPQSLLGLVQPSRTENQGLEHKKTA